MLGRFTDSALALKPAPTRKRIQNMFAIKFSACFFRRKNIIATTSEIKKGTNI
jgi:hypothetical protein